MSDPIISDLFSTAKTRVIFMLFSKSLSKGLSFNAIFLPNYSETI